MQPPRPERILLLGTSTRAAAESARAAGFSVTALDRFGDEDLRQVADWQCLGATAEAVADQLAALGPPPVMITGGGERWLACFTAASRRGDHLLAPSPHQFTELSDPALLGDLGRRSGLPLPAVRHTPPPSRQGERWLWKPRDSYGGIGVARGVSAARGEGYWQRFHAGRAYGASFLATDRHVWLLGICRMLRTERRVPIGRFVYAGSAGPVRPAPALAARLRQLGGAIARRIALRGLFGVDLLRDRCGHWWLLEVNPRYSASMELLETPGKPLAAMHVAAFRGDGSGDDLASAHCRAVRGIPGGVKRVLYARRPLVFGAGWDWSRWRGEHLPPRVQLADRPAVPAKIEVGEPVLTVRARAGSAAGCLRAARDASIALHREAGVR